MQPADKQTVVILWVPHDKIVRPHSFPDNFVVQAQGLAAKRGIDVLEADGGRSSREKVITPQGLWRWAVLKYAVAGVIVHLDALLDYYNITAAPHKDWLPKTSVEKLRHEVMASFAKNFGVSGALNCAQEYDLHNNLRQLEPQSPLAFAADKVTQKQYPCVYEALEKRDFPIIGSITQQPDETARLLMRFLLLGKKPLER